MKINKNRHKLKIMMMMLNSGNSIKNSILRLKLSLLQRLLNWPLTPRELLPMILRRESSLFSRPSKNKTVSTQLTWEEKLERAQFNFIWQLGINPMLQVHNVERRTHQSECAGCSVRNSLQVALSPTGR